MKTSNLIISWLLLSYAACLTERLSSPFDKNMKVRGFKNFNFHKHFSEFGKIWKCRLGISKIPIFHLFYELGKSWKYTQPKTNIELFQKETKQRRGLRLWNFQRYWKNKCNFKGLIKNNVEFPGVIKKIMWNFQGSWF